jgi:hypothetical protein
MVIIAGILVSFLSLNQFKESRYIEEKKDKQRKKKDMRSKERTRIYIQIQHKE